MSGFERTGWRDQALSERHRRWGRDCPGCDIDLLMLEYHRAEPIAVIEFKAEGAPRPDLAHPNYRATAELATRARIPFFIAVYTRDWIFTTFPGNELAEAWVSAGQRFSEAAFVSLLYDLRGLQPPTEVLAMCGGAR